MSRILTAIAKFIESIKGNKVNCTKKHKTAKDAKNRLQKDIDSHKIKNN